MAEVLLTFEYAGAREAQGAIDSLNTRLGTLSTETHRAAEHSKRLTSAFSALSLLRAPIAIPAAIAASLAGFVTLANDYQLLGNRLKLVTGESGDLVDAQQRLFELSQFTGTSFETNLQLFNRLAQNAQTIGLSGEQIFQVTANLNQLVVISGASAEESSAALIQLSQGFASGELRGEELRSVMEQLPAVAREVAEQLGLTIGQFRELSFAGKITASDVANALIAATSKIRERFEEMGDTAGQAFQRTKNSILILAGTLGKVTGVMDRLTETLNTTSGLIQSAATVIKRLQGIESIKLGNVGDALVVLGVKLLTFVQAEVIEMIAKGIEMIAARFSFFGAGWIGNKLAGLAEGLNRIADEIREDLDGQSFLDALFPETAAVDAAEEAKRVEEREANERKAAEHTAKRKAELAAELEALREKELEKARKEAEARAKEIRDLEADRLAFMAETNAATLEEVRALWRMRLEERAGGTRDHLEALEELAGLNESIAEREIALVTENTALTEAQQHARLLEVRESFEAQAAAVELGAERYSLGIAATNEALRALRTSLDENRGEAFELAVRFQDTFTTVPGTIIGILDGVRGSFRSFLTDVFTRTKGIGESLKDMFASIGQSILASFAQLLADQLIKSLLGIGGGLLGGIGDILSFEGGEGGGLFESLFGGGEGEGFSFGKLFEGSGTAAIATAGIGLFFALLTGADPFESLGQAIGSAIGGALAGPLGSLVGGFLGKTFLGGVLENIFGGDPLAPLQVAQDSGEVRGLNWFSYRRGNTGYFSLDYGSWERLTAARLLVDVVRLLQARGYEPREIPAFSTAVRVFPNDERRPDDATRWMNPELLYRIGLSGPFDVVQSGNYKAHLSGTPFGAGHKLVVSDSIRPTPETIEFVADQLEAIIPHRQAQLQQLREQGAHFDGVTSRVTFAVNERGQGSLYRIDHRLSPQYDGIYRIAAQILRGMVALGYPSNMIAPFTVAYFSTSNRDQAAFAGQLLFRVGGPVGTYSPFHETDQLVAFAIARLAAVGPISRAAVGASRVVTSPTAFLAGEAGHERAVLRSLSSSPRPLVVNINETVMIGSDVELKRYARQIADQLEAA